MQTKLTLRLEDDLIARAKKWARGRGVSLSQAVAGFFSQLEVADAPPTLSPWAKRISGAGRTGKRPPTDDAVRRDRVTRLDRKHR